MPDAIGNELNRVAADLLRGPNPSIPEEGVDRTAFAFECAKEMLIECINERELGVADCGRISRIVRRRDHKHNKGNG